MLSLDDDWATERGTEVGLAALHDAFFDDFDTIGVLHHKSPLLTFYLSTLFRVRVRFPPSIPQKHLMLNELCNGLCVLHNFRLMQLL